MAVRKGVFFTVMAVILAALFISGFKTNNATSVLSADMEAARTRVSVMNAYVIAFEQHAANSLEVSGYLALENLSRRVRSSGSYIADINGSLRGCLIDSALQLSCLHANQTINTSLDNFIRIADSNLTVQTSYKLENVWVTEEQPFEVILWMNISYNISDQLVEWRGNRVVRAPVNVNGIEDPLFAKAVADGSMLQSRVFAETPYRFFELNISTFPSYQANASYIYYPEGRSVLQRYAGTLTSGSLCCGIESVLNSSLVPPLILADPQLVNWSFVDYYYVQRGSGAYRFDCEAPTVGRVLPALFPDHLLRLDRVHIYNVYHLNGSEEYTCTP